MVLNKPKSINHMNHVFDVVLFIIYFLLQDEQKILNLLCRIFENCGENFASYLSLTVFNL